MVLAGPAVLLSFPLAFGFGVAGVVRDRKKLLAVAVTLVTASLVVFYLLADNLNILC